MVKPHEVFTNKRGLKMIKIDFVKDDGEKVVIDWKIKPLTPRLMVHNFKNFAALENHKKDTKDMTLLEQGEMMEGIAPLIDIILPKCCVEPKVVFEGDTTANQINIDDIDLPTLMEIFAKIFEASGVNPEKEAERANLQKVPSPKV